MTSSNPNKFPKALLLMTSYWRLVLQHVNLGAQMFSPQHQVCLPWKAASCSMLMSRAPHIQRLLA